MIGSKIDQLLQDKSGEIIILEFLGLQKSTPKSKRKVNMAIVECPVCHETRNQVIYDIKGHTKCRVCASKGANITHGGSGTRLYSIWQNIKYRCYYPECINFDNYGGRGITMCRSWRTDFGAFQAWALTNGYEKNLQIDRIDVNGDYAGHNCRWVSPSQNAQNTRIRQNGSSKFRGVCKHSNGRHWMARIHDKGKPIYLGLFLNERDAAMKYNEYVAEHQTEHTLNFIS